MKESKPYDKLVDTGYKFTSYIPLGGKVATKIFDKLELTQKMKDFSNTFFNPLFFKNRKRKLTSKS